jgi:hypothetical protein
MNGEELKVENSDSPNENNSNLDFNKIIDL